MSYNCTSLFIQKVILCFELNNTSLDMKAKILFFFFRAEITHIQNSGNFKFGPVRVFL